ncbi:MULTISPECIES: DEAD/DEAH box helicase [Capnocytophaga]|uniref:RNA helicase n=1 Tax=Capnocytophaga canis TaxID=1848903 RepID=A0A0B7IPW7_9FLAO|nr:MULTISPECIES: DEAD/DEAH box helicase [Capnocytophaga]ATA73730.1 ATP-dependent RNA helicase [Capnocytophaga sp. H4358]CEN53865.1 ATP-dependent RNA helicase deaD-like protein [Capnocytophaga canis]
MNSFKQLGLNESILKAITDMGFEKPSEIQEKAIPTLLSEDVDMVALAQTGTGKTAAFGFPLLQKIDAETKETQALILSPTRELCLQITSELKLYSKYMSNIHVVAIYGGASIEEQTKSIRKGAQIIVATPGRMQDMIRRGFVNISNIDICVLDEADEMLNMGFYEDITSILSHTPDTKNTWLFSATMPNEVAKIARQFMYKPFEVTVGSRNQASNNIRHEYYMVNGRHRYQALKRLADANPDIFSVVFCRTKKDTQAVAEKLIEDGYNAAALHGDLSQNQRDLVMKSFRARQIQMLVATDVAARGIDVDDITHVIHYQLPDETETYTHRSGRTGRAGKSGVSMVIIPKSEVKKIKSIEKIIQQPFEQKPLPSGIEICEIQLYHLANNIKNSTVETAIEDYLPAIYDVLQGLDREEIIKRMVAVEFSRFFNYYKNAEDLNASNGKEKGSSDNGEVRYFINIGERDGYDWKTLKDFLKATLNLDRDDVFKVDVKNSFSFFNTDAELVDLVTSTFNDFQLDGRFVNVEISKKEERGSGRNGRDSRGKGEFKGRNRGDSKRRDRDSKSEGRSSSRRKDRGRGQKAAQAFDNAFKRKKRK